MTLQNPLKTWLESLTIAQHKEALSMITNRFGINRTTVYLWKSDKKRFSIVEIEELNRISLSINNSKIFEV